MRKKGLILAVALGLMMTFTGCSIIPNKITGTTSQSISSTESITQGDGTEEIKATNDGDSDEGNNTPDWTINLAGVKFTIPREYVVNVPDEGGKILIDEKNENWAGVVVVKDDDYTTFVEDKDQIVSGVKNKEGYHVNGDVQTDTIDGKEYTWFSYTIDGDNGEYMVVYTGACDSKRLGMNVMIVGNIDEKAVLKEIDSCLHSVSATDAADTTSDEFYGTSDVEIGEKKTESTISTDGVTVTYSVPDNYYSQGTEDMGDYVTENFTSSSKDDFVTADVSLYKNFSYENEKAYIMEQKEYLVDGGYKNFKVDEKEITLDSGQKAYCISAQYDSEVLGEEGTVYRYYVATMIDGKAFVVKGWSMDTPLSTDDMDTFIKNAKGSK